MPGECNIPTAQAWPSEAVARSAGQAQLVDDRHSTHVPRDAHPLPVTAAKTTEEWTALAGKQRLITNRLFSCVDVPLLARWRGTAQFTEEVASFSPSAACYRLTKHVGVVAVVVCDHR